MNDIKSDKSGYRAASIMAGPSIMAGLCVSLVLAGCTSASVDNVTPVNTTPVVVYGSPDDQSVDAAAVSGGPRKSGAYPTFGKPLRAATQQMTAQEVSAMRADMEGIAAARASGAISEAEYQAKLAEMQKLAAEHGADAKREIEN
ncbi:hypothetical protein [Pararhizobium sp.]|uniref:hypothetical protein n=1 Tax=Pararhizobium sp. TaxID=1977563 RepID=UPI0027283425|nr:hypothetical protein [Pararhizobium sp.]MDO9415377.1 hypothetical protein [Pararhizobium sp.]